MFSTSGRICLGTTVHIDFGDALTVAAAIGGRSDSTRSPVFSLFSKMLVAVDIAMIRPTNPQNCRQPRPSRHSR
jgi:hypothetical protein